MACKKIHLNINEASNLHFKSVFLAPPFAYGVAIVSLITLISRSPCLNGEGEECHENAFRLQQ